MNLEKLGSLKVRRKMYAWAVEDCDVWMNEIMRMARIPAQQSHSKLLMLYLSTKHKAWNMILLK